MLRLLKVINLIIFTFIFAHSAGAMDQTAILRAANFKNCARVEILGVGVTMVGGKPTLGLKIRHWRPELLCETVIKPGDSVIAGFGDFLQKTIIAKKAFGPWGGVSSGPQSTSLAGRGNLQFSETHIYNFPFADVTDGLMKLWCLPTIKEAGQAVLKSPFVIKYLSELDPVEWRLGIAEAFHPKSILSYGIGPFCGLTGALPDKWSGAKELCMGFWGPLYPRRGYIVHQSKVVGSAADAYRAVSISSLSPINAMHVVPSRLNFNPSTIDMLQLAFPKPSGCIKIGQNPATWDYGMVSPNGKYLWIYWRHVECVIPFHP